MGVGLKVLDVVYLDKYMKLVHILYRVKKQHACGEGGLNITSSSLKLALSSKLHVHSNIVTSLDQKNGLSWLISNRFSLQAVNHAAHY
jgi:hypothetical protein